MRRSKPSSGFTVIEMAVAIVVLAMLLGSLLVPLQTQVEESKVREAETALAEIKEALTGFAAANGYLPCPDSVTSNDGVENVAAGWCSGIVGEIVIGNVPWATLGLPKTTDPWGNRYRYAVIEMYARRTPNTTFTLGSLSIDSLRVCTEATCAAELANAAADAAVAIVLSHGRNGYGAINSLTNTANVAPTSADELENTDSDANYVFRARTALGSTAGEFDDVVAWLSRYTLVNRMVAAGRLP